MIIMMKGPGSRHPLNMMPVARLTEATKTVGPARFGGLESR